VHVPIFVTEKVMDRAAITPDEEIGPTGLSKEEEEKLSVFRDFVDSLDLDDLGQE
jgi:bifunctional DNase/RNase